MFGTAKRRILLFPHRQGHRDGWLSISILRSWTLKSDGAPRIPRPPPRII